MSGDEILRARDYLLCTDRGCGRLVPDPRGDAPTHCPSCGTRMRPANEREARFARAGVLRVQPGRRRAGTP